MSPNLVIASEKAIRIIAYLNKSMARLHDEQKINILNILLPISNYAPEEFDQEGQDKEIYYSDKESEA
ncbi:unnamed protein product [Rhizophagus irregularis]|nr:unnamed protein product [Rhizophagus irregularis]CAB5383873.1 unnamed protein product [Rhizophagus irregularis]